MKVFKDLEKLPNFTKAVITIGSFDGIHIGHQKLIEQVKWLSQEIEGENVVVTFHPHPRSVVYPNDKSLLLLNSLEEKLALLESYGVDNVVVVPFTIEFSQQSPREYIEKFLISCFNPEAIVIGYDHRFGLNREGDFRLLRQYEEKGHFKLIEIKKQELDEIAISSTKIRNAIQRGDINDANGYLGYPYLLSGKVIHGQKIGTKIGFPTANIEVENKFKLVPLKGIYAVKIKLNDDIYDGMLYIGDRSTVVENGKTGIEVNIFDFDDNLYDERISISIIERLREDKKFKDLSSLKSQLHVDKINAMRSIELHKDQVKGVSKCTIAILNYNGLDYLESYLHTVAYSSDESVDIAVIDNGSTDESIESIEEWNPEVEVINLSRNYGFAGGYNKGLVGIESEYVVLLNSDVKVVDNWLDPILKYMDENQDVAAMQPKILSLEEPNKFEYAGAAGGYIDLLGYPFCRGRIFDTLEEDKGQYNDIREVFWTSGACMVVRTKLFKEIGGFDADFFAHQEEIDLCWKFKRAGYKCMVDGSVKVYHLGGGTLDYESPKKTYLNFRNNLNMIIKNEKAPYVFFTFLIRLGLDGIAGIKFLVEGKWRNTWAVVRAHLTVYFMLPKTISKRDTYSKKIKALKIGHRNRKGRYNGILLIDYFLKGYKTFDKYKLWP